MSEVSGIGFCIFFIVFGVLIVGVSLFALSVFSEEHNALQYVEDYCEVRGMSFGGIDSFYYFTCYEKANGFVVAHKYYMDSWDSKKVFEVL